MQATENKPHLQKVSIRFFNDCEVRAIWDDEHQKWWFSVELVSATNQLKLLASGGKRYKTSVLDTDGIMKLAAPKERKSRKKRNGGTKRFSSCYTYYNI